MPALGVLQEGAGFARAECVHVAVDKLDEVAVHASAAAGMGEQEPMCSLRTGMSRAIWRRKGRRRRVGRLTSSAGERLRSCWKALCLSWA